MITYVAVGWAIRSFYFNEIDRDLATQVQEGRLAMNLIRPVDFQTVMIADAAGQSAFRAVLFTIPISFVLALLFPLQPPASAAAGLLFLVSAVLSFFLVAALNFLVGLIAIRSKSILGILRAKYLVLELLSGLLIPTTLFPEPLRTILFWSPFPHINFTPATLYLGKAAGSRPRGCSRSRRAGRSPCSPSASGRGGVRACASRSRADEHRRRRSPGTAGSSASTSRSTRRPGWSTDSTSSRASSRRSSGRRPPSASC